MILLFSWIHFVYIPNKSNKIFYPNIIWLSCNKMSLPRKKRVQFSTLIMGYIKRLHLNYAATSILENPPWLLGAKCCTKTSTPDMQHMQLFNTNKPFPCACKIALQFKYLADNVYFFLTFLQNQCSFSWNESLQIPWNLTHYQYFVFAVSKYGKSKVSQYIYTPTF